MGLKLITALVTEPITKAQVKSHLRLDAVDTSEDSQLDIWIKSAREYGEKYTGRAFGSQTWELSKDYFPSESYIELPKAPLQSITSIKYTDATGTEATMSSSDYIVDTRNEPGKIVLGYSKIWPVFTPQTVNAVVIRFVCGYDGVNNIIPQSFIQAMLFHVGLYYKYRDAEIPQECIDSVNRIYYPDRIFTF